ncbi:MAG: class I SAM-dependent methyltransferase [Proteobacteria bacterium]|nr:class I SAM-dependent methyltransferase [Pseudomonadota bacterium]
MSTMSDYENFREKYTNAGRIGSILIDRFYDAVREVLQGRVSELSSILEIGVGEGFSTQRIRRMLPPKLHFEASEFRDDLAPLAQQRNPDVIVSQESIYALKRETCSFDLILCLEVLEHLEDPVAAMEELARVSRKYVIVSVPREPIWRMLNLMRGKYIGSLGNTPGHIQHWSARAFQKFSGTLFEVLDMRTPLPWTVLLLQKKT